jgi:CelD/BcsL family acetyltransferase involved in cellulose biosynthesis
MKPMLATPDRIARGDIRSLPLTVRASRVGGARFDVVMDQRPDEFARRWTRTPSQSTVFQSESFLWAWYATIARTVGEPLLLSAIDRNSGELAAMLPLVRRTAGRLRIVEFADHCVSDSNAPVLGPAAPASAADALAMWEAAGELLDADVVRFTKMPPEIEGRINPLTLLPSARLAALTGNVLTTDGNWHDYLASLRGTLRKQLRKSWRIFSENEGATFRRIEDPDEAVSVLAELARQQGARLRAQGQSYRLDDPEFATFYRDLVAEGVADGSVVLTALMRHDEVVAALLGLARGSTYVMVRISAASGRWASCSPGRLVIVQTMQMLHAEGFRVFDFSVGEYPYKRRLGARSQPLFELTEALTLRGLPLLAYDRAKGFVRQHPALHGLARRIVKRDRVAETAADDRA